MNRNNTSSRQSRVKLSFDVASHPVKPSRFLDDTESILVQSLEWSFALVPAETLVEGYIEGGEGYKGERGQKCLTSDMASKPNLSFSSSTFYSCVYTAASEPPTTPDHPQLPPSVFIFAKCTPLRRRSSALYSMPWSANLPANNQVTVRKIIRKRMPPRGDITSRYTKHASHTIRFACCRRHTLRRCIWQSSDLLSPPAFSMRAPLAPELRSSAPLSCSDLLESRRTQELNRR